VALGPGEFFMVEPHLQYGPFAAGASGAVFIKFVATVDGLFPIFENHQDPLIRRMVDFLQNQFDAQNQAKLVGQLRDEP
jgi:hypothetical protein